LVGPINLENHSDAHDRPVSVTDLNSPFSRHCNQFLGSAKYLFGRPPNPEERDSFVTLVPGLSLMGDVQLALSQSTRTLPTVSQASRQFLQIGEHFEKGGQDQHGGDVGD